MGERGRPPAPGLLTPAEERVLEHVRAGQTNAEIAVRLGISINTVRYHVSNLLSKAGVSERGDLAGWRPSLGPKWTRRPGWLWLSAAGLGAFGLAMAGVMAFAGIGETDEGGDVVLPAGYRPYDAEELEALGLVDIGPVFEMPDGSEPVLGLQLRDAAAVAALREGAEVTLTRDPCCSWGSGTAFMLLQAEAPWGELSIAVFSGGTGAFEFESYDVRPWARAPDGRPLAGVRVWNAGRGYPYGDGRRESLSVAVDGRGHLFVGETPVAPDVPIDETTGRAMRLAAAEVVARDWPGLPADYPEQGSSRCGQYTVGGNCVIGLYSGMRAPVAGRLTCAAGESTYRLESAEFVLVFSRRMTLPGYPQCTGEGVDRQVAAGEEFETGAWWGVSAETLDGQPLDVARSDSGLLYVGTNMAPDQACPCVGSN